MADTKTSDEAAADALTGAELVRIVQGGASKRTTAQDIADLTSGVILGQVGGTNVIIPGLAASPDIRVAGAADDEFDTTDASDPMTGWTTLGAPTSHDINSTAKSHYYVVKSAAAGDALHGIYKACPSIPFTMTAKLSAARLSGDYNGAGIFIAEASPGKLDTLFASRNSNVATVEPKICTSLSSWTNRTTFNAHIVSIIGADAPIFLRIVVTSSTDVAYYHSRDGLIYRLLTSGRSPGFTVGAVGLFVNSNNATYAGEAAFDWVRFS